MDRVGGGGALEEANGEELTNVAALNPTRQSHRLGEIKTLTKWLSGRANR